MIDKLLKHLGWTPPEEDKVVTEKSIPPYISEEKNFVGINNDLIELEIHKRVQFKMSEFNTSLRNIKASLNSHYSLLELPEKIENQRLAKAIAIVEERLQKETNMGGIYDRLFYDNLINDKNKLVDEITKTIIKREDRDFQHKQSKVNNLIEQHIYKHNI